MPKLRPLIVLGAGVLLTLAAAGCSGDNEPSNASASVGGGSGQTINLSQSAARLSELKSFRFNAKASIDYEGTVPSTAEDAFGNAMLDLFLASLKDIEIEGSVVAPDQIEVKADLSGQKLGFVQIKDKAWVQYFGAWQAVEPEDLGLEDSLDFSDFAADALPPEVLQAAKVTKEKVNGVDTTRYSFDKAALESLAEDNGATGQEIESADMNVWLTDDGVPVKFTLKMKGEDENGQKIDMQAEFNITDLNGNISIKAPS